MRPRPQEAFPLQGGPQSTPGTSHEWQAPTTESHAPPGSETYRKFSGQAVASFILSLAALPITWIPFANVVTLGVAIAGFSLGIKSFRECNSKPELRGLGMAITGITLGLLAIMASVASLVFWVVIFIDETV